MNIQQCWPVTSRRGDRVNVNMVCPTKQEGRHNKTLLLLQSVTILTQFSLKTETYQRDIFAYSWKPNTDGRLYVQVRYIGKLFEILSFITHFKISENKGVSFSVNIYSLLYTYVVQMRQFKYLNHNLKKREFNVTHNT